MNIYMQKVVKNFLNTILNDFNVEKLKGRLKKMEEEAKASNILGDLFNKNNVKNATTPPSKSAPSTPNVAFNGNMFSLTTFVSNKTAPNIGKNASPLGAKRSFFDTFSVSGQFRYTIDTLEIEEQLVQEILYKSTPTACDILEISTKKGQLKFAITEFELCIALCTNIVEQINSSTIGQEKLKKK